MNKMLHSRILAAGLAWLLAVAPVMAASSSPGLPIVGAPVIAGTASRILSTDSSNNLASSHTTSGSGTVLCLATSCALVTPTLTGNVNLGITTSSPFTSRINIGDAIGLSLPLGATAGTFLYQASNDGAGHEAIFQSAGSGAGLTITSYSSTGTLATPLTAPGGGQLALKAVTFLGPTVNNWRTTSLIEIGAAVASPSTNADQLGSMKFYNWNGSDAGATPGMVLGYMGSTIGQALALTQAVSFRQYNLGWDNPTSGISTDSEYAYASWGSNIYTIGTGKTNAGTNRNIAFAPGGTTALTLPADATGNATVAGTLSATSLTASSTVTANLVRPTSDLAFDLGTVSVRWRNTYVQNVLFVGTAGGTNTAVLTPLSDGYIALYANSDGTKTFSIGAPAAGIVGLRGATITTPAAAEFYTYAASPPAAPAASMARLYSDTSGGKIRIMALFPSGAAQQIAIEP